MLTHHGRATSSARDDLTDDKTDLPPDHEVSGGGVQPDNLSGQWVTFDLGVVWRNRIDLITSLVAVVPIDRGDLGVSDRCSFLQRTADILHGAPEPITAPARTSRTFKRLNPIFESRNVIQSSDR